MPKKIYIARDGELNGGNDGNLIAYNTIPEWEKTNNKYFKFGDRFLSVHADCENCTDIQILFSNGNGQNFPEIKNGEVWEAEFNLVKRLIETR